MVEHTTNSISPNNRVGFPGKSTRATPSAQTEPRRYNQETEQAIDDVLNGRNLCGPFYTVEEFMRSLELDNLDDVDD